MISWYKLVVKVGFHTTNTFKCDNDERSPEPRFIIDTVMRSLNSFRGSKFRGTTCHRRSDRETGVAAFGDMGIVEADVYFIMLGFQQQG